MTPREAMLVEFEEPDWRERFGEYRRQRPGWPRYLADDEAYEETLRDWRRFHATPVIVKDERKSQPADAIKGMVVLAGLGIFPARMLDHEVPRAGELFQAKHDAHEWLTISGRAWHIEAIEDKILLLDSFGEAKQIELNKVRWDKHNEAAAAFLRAAYPED